MGKRDGQILAFLHFAITEMRPLVLLWYTVYSTFANVVTSAAVQNAYGVQSVVACIYFGHINSRDVADCAKSAYRRYLPSGPQDYFKDCSDKCPGSAVGISAPEPRIMFFFMTTWLLGLYLLFLVYCVYHHPDYYSGRYIKFTQTLYSSKVYKVLTIVTFLLSVIMILLGIFLLIKYNEGWTQYIVALLLMVMASRTLLRQKSNGLDIRCEKFCGLKISRGNTFMKVWNFFLTTNAGVLDALEVEFMKKGLPRDLVAPEERKEGCSAFFTWHTLLETPRSTSSEDLLGGEEICGTTLTERV
ncbi:uncharacterized protein LOC114529170 [Dendronephthya gigantea]|uniref:uncharacterized protein LOC114529170 n=1 Tax=Dendronephthya gigantea TaxID=151771 RepID=UPI001068E309|nr:uncharacterized protein LOC114529170 [Dendronephthya gigantea]